MKSKFRDEHGDIDVSWYTQDDLLNLAFDRASHAKMDLGDLSNIIKELGIRLQKTTDELYRLSR